MAKHPKHPKAPSQDLSDLTLSQIELALRVVSESLASERSPEEISPQELRHLSPLQWQNLYLAHQHLMMQRQNSPLH
jgi:hypothetical protein